MNNFIRGTQIAYIPLHATGINHKDVEFGFVTSPAKNGAWFCRYWYSKKITRIKGELRTKSCSEETPADRLIKYRSCSQQMVENALREFCS